MSLGRYFFSKSTVHSTVLCIKTRRGQEHERQPYLSSLLLSWEVHSKKTHSVYAAWMNDFVLCQKNKPNQPCTVSREKDQSVSFLSSLPVRQFQASSKHSLVLNVIPFMIEKLGCYSPLRLDTQCVLGSAVNYPYFSWFFTGFISST